MKRILVVDDSAPSRDTAAAVLGSRGYVVSTASDGDEALATLEEGTPVDLVLLDLVMPLVDGLHFCRALREHPKLAETPVVLMSDPGDPDPDRYVGPTGALDAIKKPFDADTLVAVLENALRRVETGTAPAPPTEVPSVPPMATLSIVPPAAGWVQKDDVLLYGSLATLAFGAVLQLLQVEKQTGVLTVVNGDREITTILRDGLIDLVQSRRAGDEFRLGRFFIEAGLVTPEEIDELEAARNRGDERPLGDVLVQSSKITQADLRAALLRQSSELVYELLRWRAGYFVLERRPPPPLAERAALRLPVVTVVLEGVRRVDEWRVMEAHLGNLDAALSVDRLAVQDLGVDRLSKTEKNVLDLVDGARTIREIISLAHMSSFDTCTILYRLLEARLVRRRE